MRHWRATILSAATLALLSYQHIVSAAAFQLYELGAPVIGTAGVGQAVTDDASISYYNPAGMAFLKSSQGMLGSQMILPRTNFSPNNATTISGNNGGNAGVLAPGLDAYYVYSCSPKLKFGISLTSPYGGALNYNNHWVGRYDVQQMTFITLNLNPSVAYQLNNWLAIGGGAAVEYANLNQSVALRLTPLVDGQLTVKASDIAPGYNLGVLIAPTNTTKIGIAYRSQIVHHLSGNVDFLNLSVTPNASTKMVMPANVIASLSQMVSDQLTLLGELGWANWSSMTNNILTVDGYSAVTPQNWHNTYRVGLGGEYKFLSALLVHAGASYDSSPTSASRRTPQLPMDRQIRLGVGLEYPVIKSVTLGLSYEYTN